MSDNVGLSVVAPLFGNLLATGMLLSPFAAILAIRRTRTLGSVNPLVLVFTVYNCLGWTVYGLVTANMWVVPANAIGMIGGVFFTMTAYTCASQRSQDMITGVLLFATVHFIFFAMLQVFALSHDAGVQLWGMSSLIVLMLYYTSPMSTMVQVMRSKDATSIYLPLAIMAVANGSAWTIYGAAIRDYNLWVPNGFGAILGVVQVLLRVVYGARKALPVAADVALQDRGKINGAGPARSSPSQVALIQGVPLSDSLALGGHHSEIEVFGEAGKGALSGTMYGSTSGIRSSTNGAYLPKGGGPTASSFTLV